MSAISLTPARRFDHTRDSQKIFRVMLDALANPGQVFHLPKTGDFFGNTLPNSSRNYAHFETLGAFLATILDHEVTFCLLGDETIAADLSSVICTSANCRSVPRDKADYVFTLQPPVASLPAQLKPGNLIYPDSSATLICLVPDLLGENPEGKKGALLELSGPGVKLGQRLWVAGTNATFFVSLGEVNAAYPLGIDVFWLTPGGVLVGLPRSTRLSILEEGRIGEDF
ncbi:MAG: phosphonate C-P lyase system protein PhnH [Chloroflexi bacterium]|uniref:Phosphonate C-P lyase system protein PhnH n=1 Tax=Candidatus Chlorohelix allophototropha TaxID=3003348 RepID=A0A8T7M5A4_9CHLR|nr:phosphonate C-P lyase system protein PhnH [Chloroflexota bacterium]WJW69127.1 phosphonate C-P lyase system protein PhnH [Chloroflexota bacterium L227-S17]